MPNLTKGRKCGGCTACCFTHSIYALAKPAKRWCPECSVGGGCRIYATRPDECKTYECMWLEGYGLDQHRPDRMHVVAQVRSAHPVGRVLWLFELRDRALRAETVSTWAYNTVRAGTPVFLLPIEGPPMLVLPLRMYEQYRNYPMQLQGAGGPQMVKIVPGI